MMMHEPLQFAGLRGKLARRVPLAKYTSWRTGGLADTLYVPADRDDLAAFLRQLPADEPLLVLGLGSNTLVRDGGVRGTVVVLHNPGAILAIADGLVYADAGVASPKLARFAANHDCADAEFLAGIPGTVGGALAMNAGCYGGETWTYVVRVEVVTRDGRFAIRTPSDYAIGYRTLHKADGTPHDDIFTAAWFRFPRGDSVAARVPHQGAPRTAHRRAAAGVAQRRQRVPQSAGRPCGAAHPELRLEGVRAGRRARVGEARELHRQPARRRPRGRHRGADRARACDGARADRRRPRARGPDRGGRGMSPKVVQ